MLIVQILKNLSERVTVWKEIQIAGFNLFLRKKIKTPIEHGKPSKPAVSRFIRFLTNFLVVDPVLWPIEPDMGPVPGWTGRSSFHYLAFIIAKFSNKNTLTVTYHPMLNFHTVSYFEPSTPGIVKRLRHWQWQHFFVTLPPYSSLSFSKYL